jgi:hypothetical protein
MNLKESVKKQLEASKIINDLQRIIKTQQKIIEMLEAGIIEGIRTSNNEHPNMDNANKFCVQIIQAALHQAKQLQETERN